MQCNFLKDVDAAEEVVQDVLFKLWTNRENIEISTAHHFIDCIYDRIVNAITKSASLFIPCHKTSYYKFWWDQELETLKESATSSDKLWKAAGRPRNGSL